MATGGVGSIMKTCPFSRIAGRADYSGSGLRRKETSGRPEGDSRFAAGSDDLSPEATVQYPRQGWGVTTDGESLIAGDGSAIVLFLDPDTFAIKRSVVVRDACSEVGFLNELEYVDGDTYANVWQTNYIVRFSAQTGAVDGWVDRDGLNPNPEKLVYPRVLNGIAYDGEPGSLLVTGKNWPSLWRIKLVPAAHGGKQQE